MEFIITDSKLVESIDDNLLNDNHLTVFKKIKKDLRQAKKLKDTYSFTNEYEKEVFKLFFNGRNFKENENAIKTLYIYAYHQSKLDNLKEATEYLEMALKINPVSVDILINLANISMKESKFDVAYSYLADAVKYSYTLTMLMNSYLLLQGYYAEIGDGEMVELIEYLLDYYEGSRDYDDEMFKLASDSDLQTGLSEKIVQKFQEIYSGEEILDLMDRDINIERLDELYESLLD